MIVEFTNRIYSVDIIFSVPGDYLDRFCRDLGVKPELLRKIEEDAWGVVNSLAIWFQEIEANRWTLHIQKMHFKHGRTYVKDLQAFARRLEALAYVKEIHFN